MFPILVSIPTSSFFSVSIFIANVQSRYSVSIPATNFVYSIILSIYACIRWFVTRQRYIYKRVQKKNPLQIETTFTFVSICMSCYSAHGIVTLTTLATACSSKKQATSEIIKASSKFLCYFLCLISQYIFTVFISSLMDRFFHWLTD